MDRQSRRDISKRVGPWPATALAVAIAGCSNYRPSDALSALREAAPIQGFAKAVSDETTVLSGLLQDSMPVYIGTTAKSFLKYARSSPDPNLRFLAYSKLGDPELYEDDPKLKAEVASVLVAKLNSGKEPLATRAVIIRTLGILGDARARDAIARSVNDPEAVVRAAACRALGKVGRPEDATVLVRVMSVDMVEDCRIAAIEGIGALKTKDSRIHQILIEAMDHEDPAIRLSSYRALKEITDKDYGNTPGPWRRELLGQAEPVAAKPDKKPDAAKEKPGDKPNAKQLAAAPSSSWSRTPTGAAAQPGPASAWASSASSTTTPPANANGNASTGANGNASTGANGTSTESRAASSPASASAAPASPAPTSAPASASMFSRLGGTFSRLIGR